MGHLNLLVTAGLVLVINFMMQSQAFHHLHTFESTSQPFILARNNILLIISFLWFRLLEQNHDSQKYVCVGGELEGCSLQWRTLS